MEHVREWPIRLYFFEEDDGSTTARVRLDTRTNTMEMAGEAHCRPGDFEVPEIGDEIAAGRALVALGQRLLHTGEEDIEDIEGRAPHLKL
jgi:nicotinate phosphoribosyltransferase